LYQPAALERTIPEGLSAILSMKKGGENPMQSGGKVLM
jgi:hypothetical protein